MIQIKKKSIVFSLIAFLSIFFFLSFYNHADAQITLNNANFTGGTTNIFVPSATVQSVNVNSSGVTIAAINAPNRTFSFYQQSSSSLIKANLTDINYTMALFNSNSNLPSQTFTNVTGTKMYAFILDGIPLNSTTGFVWFPFQFTNNGNSTNGTNIEEIFVPSGLNFYSTCQRSFDLQSADLTVLSSTIPFNMNVTLINSLNQTVSNLFFGNVNSIQQHYSSLDAGLNYYWEGVDPSSKVIVFNCIAYGNTFSIAGFNVFDTIFGTNGLFGVPLIWIIVLVVASSITAKNSVIGLIVTVALIGLLGAAGLINSISNVIWSIVILLAAIGVFMGKKIWT